MIITEYEVTILPVGRGLYSPFDTSSENNDSSVVERCKETDIFSSNDDETKQESALPIQSEVQNDSPNVTGTITIITRKKGHDQDSIVKTYFNGKEASVMLDTGSTVSTIHYDDPTQSRIIKIGKKRTCSRICKDTDDSTKSGEKDDIELASVRGDMPQNVSDDELQELLPNFNGTSA